MIPLLAALLLALPAGCGGRKHRVPLEVEVLDRGLLVAVTGLPDAHLHMVLGRPFRGRGGIRPDMPGVAFELLPPRGGAPELKVLRAGRLPAGKRVELDLEAERLQPGAWVLQVVATPEDELRNALATSRPVGVRVDEEGRPELWSPPGRTLERSWTGLLLLVGVLLAGCLVARLRWPGPLPRRLGLGLLAALTGGLLLLRHLDPDPRERVEAGFGHPPVLWRSDWTLGGDGWERLHGPGFRELLEAALRLRQPGQVVQVTAPPARPGKLAAAVSLARLLAPAELVLEEEARSPGLTVVVGDVGDEEALARSPLGAVVRGEDRDR